MHLGVVGIAIRYNRVNFRSKADSSFIILALSFFLYNFIILLFIYLMFCGIGMGRSSDIHDVILNTIGAVVGVGFYILWVKITKLVSQKIKSSDLIF